MSLKERSLYPIFAVTLTDPTNLYSSFRDRAQRKHFRCSLSSASDDSNCAHKCTYIASYSHVHCTSNVPSRALCREVAHPLPVAAGI